MKYIAVEGCTLSMDKGSGNVSITTPASFSVKADGKGVYSGMINISITNYIGGQIDVPGTGIGQGVLVGAAKKVKVNGNPTVLEGDNCIIVVNGMKNTDKGPIPAIPVNVKVTVKNSGQKTVKGE